MFTPTPNHLFGPLSRRELLERGGTGLGMLGLAAVLDQAGELGLPPPRTRPRFETVPLTLLPLDHRTFPPKRPGWSTCS